MHHPWHLPTQCLSLNQTRITSKLFQMTFGGSVLLNPWEPLSYVLHASLHSTYFFSGSLLALRLSVFFLWCLCFRKKLGEIKDVFPITINYDYTTGKHMWSVKGLAWLSSFLCVSFLRNISHVSLLTIAWLWPLSPLKMLLKFILMLFSLHAVSFFLGSKYYWTDLNYISITQ